MARYAHVEYQVREDGDSPIIDMWPKPGIRWRNIELIVARAAGFGREVR
jgi:hypothetical protein